jgi:hypothetical protein
VARTGIWTFATPDRVIRIRAQRDSKIIERRRPRLQRPTCFIYLACVFAGIAAQQQSP